MSPVKADELEAVTLARIDERLTRVEKDVGDIKSIFRWFAITIGASVILAFVNFALNGGLKAVGGP